MNRRPDSSVHVVPYSTTWPEAFLSERRALEAVLGGVASSIEHTGSTAVPGLSAKPTIDILVVVDSIDELRERIPRIEELGYDHRPSNTLVGSEDHLFLRKVSGGKRTHHLHVVRSGSPEIDDYRLFRDALRENSSLADRYERLKIDLADEHGDDRMRYVTEKANWVGDVVASLRARRR